MEVSEIKEEVEHFEDLKVKLEENPSSVVYDVEVTSKVEVKPKEEQPPQSSFTSVTKEVSQHITDTAVKSEKNPLNDELELELGLKNNSNGDSKIESESNSYQECPQQTSKSSQASFIKSNQHILKRRKRSVKIEKRHLLQCTLCPQSFPKVELLITHARNKHATVKNPRSDPVTDDEDTTLVQCPLCPKALTTVQGLQSHFVNFHIKNKPFHCSLCLESKNEIKKFPTDSVLKRHIATVHNPARFKLQCDICSQKFTCAFHYNNHKEIHIEKKYKCDYCYRAYRKKDRMLRHIIAVHKEYTDRHETFKCDFCEELFCSKKDLEFHVLQAHVEDTVQCKICSKKFLEEGELNKHLDIAHIENRIWLECDVCSKVFKNNQKLVEHLEVEHKRLFKCRKCFRSFVSEEECDNHSTEILDEEGRHAEQPQLQCKICLIFLNTECAFTTHKDTHLNPSEIKKKIITQLDPTDPQDCLMKCDFCPKTFVQKSLLLDHATKYHRNQKWKCKSCDKSFQVKFQLNKHELLHSAKKLFECPVCHKGFANIQYLKTHKRIHKKDKMYKCSQCKKSFAVSLGLRLHMANYHGAEKPFKCDICQKTFAVKKLLVEHSLSHTDERPFSCSKCSYASKCAKQLRAHQRRIHSENPSRTYKMPMSHPVRLGPHLKYFEDLVYVCLSEECDFETKDEKEVALHNAMHGLPLLILSSELPCPLVKDLNSSTLTSWEKIKNRTVQPRFKCKYCCKMYTIAANLKKHVQKFHSGKRVERHPVNHRRESKYAQKLMFVCSLKECDFETKDEIEVAIHYAKHKLPKVVLPRLLHGPSSEVFLSKLAPMNKHAIQFRYKCTQCFKALSSPGSLRRHRIASHKEKRTKRKKRVYTVYSSDEDEI